MKIYLIAGEISGDFIGSKLMDSLNKISQNFIEINGIGGLNMKEKALNSLFDIKEINLMGFCEVLPHIFRIKKLINKTVEDIIEKKSDILVTIDSPGFTYRVAQKLRLKAPHIKLVHVVAPSVWAYKPSRAIKYANLYDHLLTLFPFEPFYFTKHGLNSTCIGHPIMEQKFYKKTVELRKEFNIEQNTKAIAVTPGSRVGEINRHMPVIREIFDRLSEFYKIKVIFIQSNEHNLSHIQKYLEGAKFNYMFTTDRLKAFAASDCALAKSGTNSFEIAASGTPMIIGYKLNALTFYLLKMMIKIKYACLINIISEQEIIPEFIQDNFNVENIVQKFNELLNDDKSRMAQVQKAEQVLNTIGFNANIIPSEIAARKIIDLIK